MLNKLNACFNPSLSKMCDTVSYMYSEYAKMAFNKLRVYS